MLSDPPTEDVNVGAAELADFFGATTQTVRDLTSKGIVVRVGHGRYMLRASNRAYIAHLRAQAAGRAASDDNDGPPDLARERALLARTQREGQAMKNAVLRGKLLPVEDVEEVVGAVLDATRAKMQALPSKLAPRCVGLEGLAQARDILTAGVTEAYEELSNTPVVAAAVDRARSHAGSGDIDDTFDEAPEAPAAPERVGVE